jgi:hypothetical protein
LTLGLKLVLIGKGTHFSPTDNELLEHLKEKMVSRISSALSFLVLRCVLKLSLCELVVL